MATKRVRFPKTVTVLWPLVVCLCSVEVVMGILAGRAEPNSMIHLGYIALVSFGLVLLTLVVMFFKNPAFLVTSGKEAVSLRKWEQAMTLIKTLEKSGNLHVSSIESILKPLFVTTDSPKKKDILKD